MSGLTSWQLMCHSVNNTFGGSGLHGRYDVDNRLNVVLQAIEKVKKENERLKEQVESETRSRSDNSAVQSHVLRLADQVQTYKNKIEIEQRRLEELDKQHKIMQATSHHVMFCTHRRM